jgi:DNA-binding transcriptional LysR family regulator
MQLEAGAPSYRRGPGLAREDIVRPYIERGELVSVLEEFSTPFPGFYLYYPARRQASPPPSAPSSTTCSSSDRRGERGGAQRSR